MASEKKDNAKKVVVNDNTFAYATFGPSTGIPLFYFHSLPGSRLEGPGEINILDKLGVYLIGIDRPGFGKSDFVEDRTIRDFVHVVEAVADELGIEEFSLLARAHGAIYALAVAHDLPDRVKACILVSPFVGNAPLTGIHSKIKWKYIKAKSFSNLFKNAIDLDAKLVYNSPDQVIYGYLLTSPKLDRDIFSNRRFLRMMRSQLKEAVADKDEAHVAQAMLQEFKLVLGDPGFQLSAIKTSVAIWHGELDTDAPKSIAQYLVTSLPNAEVRTMTGEGHMILYRHWDAILAFIRNAAGQATGAAGAVAAHAVSPMPRLKLHA